MARPSYLYRRGARYYFRIRVPSRLAVATDRREIKFSLRTADFATARRRAARAASTFITMVEGPDPMPKKPGASRRTADPKKAPDPTERLITSMLREFGADALVEPLDPEPDNPPLDGDDDRQAPDWAAMIDAETGDLVDPLRWCDAMARLADRPAHPAPAPTKEPDGMLKWLRSFGGPAPVDEELLCLLAQDYYHTLLTLDKQERFTDCLQDADIGSRAELVRVLARDLARGQVHWVESAVQNAVRTFDLDVPIPAEGSAEPDSRYTTLCFVFMRAYLEANRRFLERDQGDFTGQPKDPYLTTAVREYSMDDIGAAIGPANRAEATSAPSERQDRQHRPLSERAARQAAMRPTELLDVFFRERDMQPATRDDYRATFKIFEQITGNKPVGEITEDDVIEFKETLLNTPANYKKIFKTESIREAIELNREARKPTLKPQSIRDKYLANVKAFFTWISRSRIRRDNPAGDVAIPLKKGEKRHRKRDPFSRKQLPMIFRAPLYTGCLSPKRAFEAGDAKIRDHRFWAPLIALFTGARSNEIGQIYTDDVILHRGFWHFKITTEADPDEPDDHRELKTENSRRLIPINQELIRIGFLDYVAEMRARGAQRLFPSWKRGKKGYSSTFGKWFNQRFLEKHGIKTPKTVFYSFRHNFSDVMRSAGIDSKVRDIMLGHSPTSMDDLYGSKEVFESEIKKVINVAYDGLDLSHISYK